MDDVEKLRMAAYKTLHLIYVKYTGPGMYRIVDSETKGGTPKLTDYISFHLNKTLIRVKDIGENIIYLLNPKQYQDSLLEVMIKKDAGLEKKLHLWFPFLWGEITEDDRIRYQTIFRQLRKTADLFEADDYDSDNNRK